MEAHENFQKHSPRSRARIMTADGVKQLSVPIVGGRGIRSAIGEVRVDYSEPFQRTHLRTIRSAYASAPYFDHFFPLIEPLFALREERLIDLNSQITERLLEILRLPQSSLLYTSQFTGTQHPEQKTAPYYQVFSHLHPFAPNLSVLDYLFCCGYL